jgi:outer membrane protein assembly factor BamA
MVRSTETPAPYEPHYGLDLIQGGLSVAPTENVVGGFQGAFSDLLGNRVYYFQVGNTAQQLNQILSRMNIGVWSMNRAHRWNYGVGVFHTAGEYVDIAGLDFFERKAGGSLVASYPFSRYRRIDGSMSIYYDLKDRHFGSTREGILATHTVSLVSDNTLWYMTGPRDGSRLNITGAVTTNLNPGQNENISLLVDIRRYFRVSQMTSFAVRAQGRASNGADPQRFIMGGSLSMRGYPRQFFEGTRMFMVNMEYRFPLLHHLVLGVPFDGFGLPGLEGAAFVDAGSAWEKFERTMPKPVGSFGFGLRMNLGGFMVLRYDFAKLTDFERVRPGWEREFYLGFDY